MDNINQTTLPPTATGFRWQVAARNTAYIFSGLLTFLFTLDLMIATLQHLGQDAAGVIVLATSNPFTGLFIGLLVTALIQSSSATTSMTVALVASGSISLESAIPILMGANVGTTITSTIISLGFINRKKEFRRAVTIGTYHDFFNILTVAVLFPLEHYFGFLSGIAQYLAVEFFNEPIHPSQTQFSILGPWFGKITHFIVNLIDNGVALTLLSIGLLFGSILFFRKVLSNVLGFSSPDRFQQFFFRNQWKSFGWGLLTTAAIRSSTITTSLVVPLVAKKVVKIKSAYPFVLGANIGTTITAFIAALFNSNAAISIAIAHFLFNLLGVVFFFLMPGLNRLPVKLATALGRLTLKHRLTGFLYLLLTFFFIPFSLIYMNKDSVIVKELTYQREDFTSGQKIINSIITKTYLNQPISSWLPNEPGVSISQWNSVKVISIYRRKNLIEIQNELFELNKPGFCRDGEDESGKFTTCILSLEPSLQLSAELSVDSVYVFEKRWYADRVVGAYEKIYISATENLPVKRGYYNGHGELLRVEKLISIRKK